MTLPLSLWPTDIHGLDVVLNGGLTHPTLGVIIGAPGAGKTVLASQIVFQAARQGQPALIFTGYSEGNTQYLEHLQAFDFFTPALLGTTIQLLTLQSVIDTDEGTLIDTLTQAIRTHRTPIVLIDGFQGIVPTLPGGASVRSFLANIATRMRYLNVTLLLTIAGEARARQRAAELTVVDLVIGLGYSLQDRRHQRLLEVVKQRGRPQLAGLHSYTLDSSGVQVFPRIEVHPTPEAPTGIGTPIPFRLPELDHLLGGGLPAGTTTLLAGAPGVGKTTLGLHWAVTTAHPDAQTVLLTFGEYPAQLRHKAAAFNLDLHGAETRGVMRVIRVAPVEIEPDQVASRILASLAMGPVRQLVIDDLTVLLQELGDRARGYLSALNAILAGRGITSVYILEIPAFAGFRAVPPNLPLAVLGDNVVVLQQYAVDSELRRLLVVLRTRYHSSDTSVRELVLTDARVQVRQLDERTRAVLRTES